MKKIRVLWTLVGLFVVLMIVQANIRTFRIYLPVSKNILSIDIKKEGHSHTINDSKRIDEIVEWSKYIKPTKGFKINEEVKLDRAHDVVEIHIHSKTSKLDQVWLYIYKKGKRMYVEQPYNGVYRLNKTQYERLNELIKEA